MNFQWALQKLKEGKKVRRPKWDEGNYWIIGIDGKICFKDLTTAHVHLNQIEATDWEVVEDNSCLSDKIVDMSQGSSISENDKFQTLKVRDVKEFVKDVIKIIKTDYVKDLKIKAIKQRVGNKLI